MCQNPKQIIVEVKQIRGRYQKPSIFWSIIGAAVLLFTTHGHTAVDPATAVAVWLFNEDSGDLAKDLTENALDAAFLDPVKWTDGKFDGGLEFKSGGLVNAGASPLLNVGKANFSMVAWFKYSKTPDGLARKLLSKKLISLCRDTAIFWRFAVTLMQITKGNRLFWFGLAQGPVYTCSAHRPSTMGSGTISLQLLTGKAR